MQNAINCTNGQRMYGELLVREYNGIIGSYNIIEYIKREELYLEFDYNIFRATVQYIQETGFNSYPIAVNIMDKTLEEFGVADLLLNELNQRGVNGGGVAVEISENTDVQNDAVIENLMKLRNGGLLIAVDDLGYGKSSVETLFKVQPDIIKVAGEIFREESITNGQLTEIIHSLLNIADVFCTKTIIEGVETDEQLNCVKQLGYKYVQGYIYGKPFSLFKARNHV